jgi:phosphoglycolate phosphatase-like HAD superfamily hydrolase
MYRAVLFDIDGTLVNSNDAHAEAWVKAFAEAGVPVNPVAVRRAIGMGGDKLIPAVSGLASEDAKAKQIAERRGAIFVKEHVPRLRAFRDAAALVSAVKSPGHRVAAASSAKKDELKILLDIAGVAHLLDARTSADDAEESKPDPDIVVAALERLRVAPAEAVLIGDTPYDVEAGRRAGVDVIALRCGGWQDHELHGAIAIYEGPWDLLAKLAESPLGARERSRVLK